STNRKMIDEMGNHRAKVMTMINRHGLDEVENFIDCCLTLENLIDLRQVGLQIPYPKFERGEEDEEQDEEIRKFPSKDYMDKYVNPKSFLDAQREKADKRKKHKKFPEHPERDVLMFLGEYAPLERWQRDLLWIVRKEAYYFAPQGMTK